MHRNMPVDLVLVRHGQSEGNLAQKLARQGKLDLWTSEFRERHNSLYRLTDTGRMQARIAGEYIRRSISPIFDKYFTSEYVRAMETAAALELPHARWATEVYLRERDRGVLANKPHHERVTEHHEEFVRKQRDAFYWQPSGGESIANLCLRVDRVLENLGENCSGLRVIVVCHGGVIKSFRALIERIRSSEYRCHDKIHNCQIVWYTRRDPKTGYISSKYNWAKSLCPWDLYLSRYTNEWREIRRHVYSNVELLRSVGQVVQLVNCPSDFSNHGTQHHASVAGDTLSLGGAPEAPDRYGSPAHQHQRLAYSAADWVRSSDGSDSDVDGGPYPGDSGTYPTRNMACSEMLEISDAVTSSGLAKNSSYEKYSGKAGVSPQPMDPELASSPTCSRKGSKTLLINKPNGEPTIFGQQKGSGEHGGYLSDCRRVSRRHYNAPTPRAPWGPSLPIPLSNNHTKAFPATPQSTVYHGAASTCVRMRVLDLFLSDDTFIAERSSPSGPADRLLRPPRPAGQGGNVSGDISLIAGRAKDDTTTTTLPGLSCSGPPTVPSSVAGSSPSTTSSVELQTESPVKNERRVYPLQEQHSLQVHLSNEQQERLSSSSSSSSGVVLPQSMCYTKANTSQVGRRCCSVIHCAVASAVRNSFQALITPAGGPQASSSSKLLETCPYLLRSSVDPPFKRGWLVDFDMDSDASSVDNDGVFPEQQLALLGTDRPNAEPSPPLAPQPLPSSPYQVSGASSSLSLAPQVHHAFIPPTLASGDVAIVPQRTDLESASCSTAAPASKTGRRRSIDALVSSTGSTEVSQAFITDRRSQPTQMAISEVSNYEGGVKSVSYPSPVLCEKTDLNIDAVGVNSQPVARKKRSHHHHHHHPKRPDTAHSRVSDLQKSNHSKILTCASTKSVATGLQEVHLGHPTAEAPLLPEPPMTISFEGMRSAPSCQPWVPLGSGGGAPHTLISGPYAPSASPTGWWPPHQQGHSAPNCGHCLQRFSPCPFPHYPTAFECGNYQFPTESKLVSPPLFTPPDCQSPFPFSFYLPPGFKDRFPQPWGALPVPLHGGAPLMNIPPLPVPYSASPSESMSFHINNNKGGWSYGSPHVKRRHVSLLSSEALSGHVENPQNTRPTSPSLHTSSSSSQKNNSSLQESVLCSPKKDLSGTCCSVSSVATSSAQRASSSSDSEGSSFPFQAPCHQRHSLATEAPPLYRHSIPVELPCCQPPRAHSSGRKHQALKSRAEESHPASPSFSVCSALSRASPSKRTLAGHQRISDFNANHRLHNYAAPDQEGGESPHSDRDVPSKLSSHFSRNMVHHGTRRKREVSPALRPSHLESGTTALLINGSRKEQRLPHAFLRDKIDCMAHQDPAQEARENIIVAVKTQEFPTKPTSDPESTSVAALSYRTSNLNQEASSSSSLNNCEAMHESSDGIICAAQRVCAGTLHTTESSISGALLPAQRLGSVGEPARFVHPAAPEPVRCVPSATTSTFSAFSSPIASRDHPHGESQPKGLGTCRAQSIMTAISRVEPEDVEDPPEDKRWRAFGMPHMPSSVASLNHQLESVKSGQASTSHLSSGSSAHPCSGPSTTRSGKAQIYTGSSRDFNESERNSTGCAFTGGQSNTVPSSSVATVHSSPRSTMTRAGHRPSISRSILSPRHESQQQPTNADNSIIVSPTAAQKRTGSSVSSAGASPEPRQSFVLRRAESSSLTYAPGAPNDVQRARTTETPRRPPPRGRSPHYVEPADPCDCPNGLTRTATCTSFGSESHKGHTTTASSNAAKRNGIAFSSGSPPRDLATLHIHQQDENVSPHSSFASLSSDSASESMPLEASSSRGSSRDGSQSDTREAT